MATLAIQRYDYCSICDRFRPCAVFHDPHFNCCVPCATHVITTLTDPKTIERMERLRGNHAGILTRLADGLTIEELREELS